jgi:hypothetical protein
MRVTGAQVLTLATPIDAHHCEFARATATVDRFAGAATANCTAAAAPAQGWKAR